MLKLAALCYVAIGLFQFHKEATLLPNKEMGDPCPCLVGGFVICSSQLLVMAELCVHIKDKHVHRNIERKKMTRHVLKFN